MLKDEIQTLRDELETLETGSSEISRVEKELSDATKLLKGVKGFFQSTREEIEDNERKWKELDKPKEDKTDNSPSEPQIQTVNLALEKIRAELLGIPMREIPMSYVHYRTDPLEYIGAAVQLNWYATFWQKQHEKLLELVPQETGQVRRIRRALESASDPEAKQMLNKELEQAANTPWLFEFIPGGVERNNEFLAISQMVQAVHNR